MEKKKNSGRDDAEDVFHVAAVRVLVALDPAGAGQRRENEVAVFDVVEKEAAQQ